MRRESNLNRYRPSGAYRIGITVRGTLDCCRLKKNKEWSENEKNIFKKIEK